jgi:6,7-dimethyl-8-ribityllumazine synthase
MEKAPQSRSGGETGVEGARILIVEARFYDEISETLLAGALRVLQQAASIVDRVIVPGSLEIPTAIAIAAEAAERRGHPYDGAVALGCVIRGETSHYDIVATESARALINVSVTLRLPVGNGILTVDTEQQARERASLDKGDKGGAAARAALALIRIKRGIAADNG